MFEQLRDEDTTIHHVVGFNVKVRTNCLCNSFASGDVITVRTFRIKSTVVSARSIRTFRLIYRTLYGIVPILL